MRFLNIQKHGSLKKSTGDFWNLLLLLLYQSSMFQMFMDDFNEVNKQWLLPRMGE